jgi:hypothetical protein
MKKISDLEWAHLDHATARTDISRSEIVRAIICGDVLGSHIKKPGRKKGKWLVNLKSLDDYIRSFLPGGSRYAQSAEATK